MFKRFQDPAEQLCEIMKRMSEKRMVSISGGNCSILDDDGVVWMTPKGMPKVWLTPDQIAKYSPDDKQLSKLRGSVEAVINMAIHRVRPDIKAVVHAHSPALLAYMLSKTQPNLNILGSLAARIPHVAYTEFRMPGSDDLKQIVTEAYGKGAETVYLENHGIFVGSKIDIYDAYAKMEAIEAAAKVEMLAHTMKKDGGIHYASDEQVGAYASKLEKQWETYPHASWPVEDIPLRDKLMDIARRAYTDDLIGTLCGSFSVRVAPNAFLITPRDCDFLNLRPDEIIRVVDGKCECGKEMPVEAELHLAIYEKHADAKSVMVSTPAYAMTYGATDGEIDTYADFECFMFAHQIARVPFDATAQAIAEKICFETPAVLADNNCFIAVSTEPFDEIKALGITQLVNYLGMVQSQINCSGRQLYTPDKASLDRQYIQFFNRQPK